MNTSRKDHTSGFVVDYLIPRLSTELKEKFSLVAMTCTGLDRSLSEDRKLRSLSHRWWLLKGHQSSIGDES